MVILQAGVAKSGNFWLYKIIQEIIGCSNFEKKSFIRAQPIYEVAKAWDLSYKQQADIDVLDIESHKCFFRISSIFRMPIENIDDYIRQCNHVWTHSAFCEQSMVVLSKFDKVVYIIRDPRDVAISMSRFVFTPYMRKYYPKVNEPDPDTYLKRQLEGLIRHWVQHVGGYLIHKKDLQIHIVFYERLLHSFDIEINHLLEYLGIELDKEVIEHIKSEVDLMCMKSENPHHVRKGKSGEWINALTDAQKNQVIRIAGPMFEILNYPIYDKSINDGVLPCMPVKLTSGQIEKAIAHAKRKNLTEKFRRVYAFIAG